VTGGAGSRTKGARIEREFVNLHIELGVPAERTPLSGATHYQGSGHDVDIYPFGRDERPLVFEVKARRGANGFRLLERWLANFDGLALRRDRQHPLVVLAWNTWAASVTKLKRLREAVECLSAQLVEREKELEACRAELQRLKSERRDVTFAKPDVSAGGSNGQTRQVSQIAGTLRPDNSPSDGANRPRA
jgi:Holliday junction resolvase